ncbi:MAG: metal-dependent hydrolase [Actinomycetota bacterium]
MLFWHLGMTCAIVFFALGARRIDYRVVLLGAVISDVIDKPIGRIFFQNQFESGRLFGHTLLVSTVLLLVIQLTLRGATARRWFILPICMLIHQVLDGMWDSPITWFWPLFGTTFEADPQDAYWLEVLTRPLDHPWVLVRELVGLAVLIYLARAYKLQDPELRRRFIRKGELIERPERLSRSDRIGGPAQQRDEETESPTAPGEGG